MFNVDKNITDLKIRDRNFFKVLFSMNVHQVANPEMSLEDARSYVFFFREGGKVLSYVGLYLIPTDRRLYYAHSSNPFPEGEMGDVEGEARAFAETLGAMLDEIDFTRFSPDEKNRWIEEQEILSGRKKGPEPADVSAAPVSTASADPEPEPPQGELGQQTPEGDTIEVQLSSGSVTAGETAVKRPLRPAIDPSPTPPPVRPAADPSPTPSRAGTVRPPVRPAIDPSPTPPPSARTTMRPSARPVADPSPTPPSAARQAEHQTEIENSAPANPLEDVIQEAVIAGVVKAPRARLKKDIRSASGVVSRDKEALARLLASF